MDIITGYRGTPHITSMQDRAKNQGVIGEGSYILDVGQQLAAEIVSANEIRVRDGVLSHQGCVANIAAGAYDSVEISNGTQGMLRTDLIVARYTKDAETNVEDISLVVIEGEAAASSPVTPAYNEGDIQAGDSPVDMPLYKVNISGVTIDSVTLIAEIVWSLQSIGNTALTTTAQTITGAIAEHESDISQINGNLSNKITYEKILQDTRFKGAKSNEWEYIGSSFTVPSGYVYIATIYQQFASGKPIGLAVTTNTTSANPDWAIQGDTARVLTAVFAAGTYYIYTMRATVPVTENIYNVTAAKIKL